LDTLKRTPARAVGTLLKVMAMRKSFTMEPPLCLCAPLLRVPRDLDHRFHGNPITDSTGSRSPVPREVDHPFHGKSIT
jgi:hypothetical protein